MKEELLEIEAIAQRYQESILSEASKNQLEKFKGWISEHIEDVILKDFEELYMTANGFEFNGLIIYSLDDKQKSNIYDLNNEWHDNADLKRFLFFGDSDISWYCYDIKDKIFCELDKPSGTLMGTYKNFSDLISTALEAIM